MSFKKSARRVLAGPWLLPLFAVAVAANVLIYGSVMAEMTMPKEISVGDRMVNEEATYTLASMNQSITDSFNITASCLGGDAVNMKLTKPLGSDSPSQVTLNLNGTNVVNEDGKKLEAGLLILTVRGVQQGLYNCTLAPQYTNQTVITWVDQL